MFVDGVDDGLHDRMGGPPLAHVGVCPPVVTMRCNAPPGDERLEGGGRDSVTEGLVLRNLVGAVRLGLVDDVLRDRARDAVDAASGEEDCADVLCSVVVACVDVKVHARLDPGRNVKLQRRAREREPFQVLQALGLAELLVAIEANDAASGVITA